jgi:hypothetical protein
MITQRRHRSRARFALRATGGGPAETAAPGAWFAQGESQPDRRPEAEGKDRQSQMQFAVDHAAPERARLLALRTVMAAMSDHNSLMDFPLKIRAMTLNDGALY